MTTDRLGRALHLYRRTATSRSAIVLLVANAIPIVGVVFFGWSLLTILVLYWIENGIVGFWNVPKIAMAQGSLLPTVLPELPRAAALAATGSPQAAADLQAAWARAREQQLSAAHAAAASAGGDPPAPGDLAARGGIAAPGVASALDDLAARAGAPAVDPSGTIRMAAMGTAMNRLGQVSRIGLGIFFAFHYGIFWLVHGLFVFALPSFGNAFAAGDGAGVSCGPFNPIGVPGSNAGPLPGIACESGAFGDVIWSNVLLAAVALFLSHGASFLFNYIGRGEYMVQSPARQMATPYGRVIVLHLTIIFGSMVVAFLGAPIGALLILIGLKTAFDLGLHLREHRNAGPPLPATPGPATI